MTMVNSWRAVRRERRLQSPSEPPPPYEVFLEVFLEVLYNATEYHKMDPGLLPESTALEGSVR